jgi:hypothetical protein
LRNLYLVEGNSTNPNFANNLFRVNIY